jgi:hypothetical protein
MKNGQQSAFPILDETSKEQMGLTKREYFAGLAMQGIMASDSPLRRDRHDVAKRAIEVADELLKKLEE